MPNIKNKSQEYPPKNMISHNQEDDYWYQIDKNVINSN